MRFCWGERIYRLQNDIYEQSQEISRRPEATGSWRSAANAAADGAQSAVELTGTAFHAGLRLDQAGFPLLHGEYRVRANCHAHGAAVAKIGVVDQSVYSVSIEHGRLRSADKDKEDG
jgi:hypothetical protein